ncbi:phosphotransferase [Arthrobacter sp. R1-13]
MQPDWSTRISWPDLPEHVRAGIEEILETPVQEWSSQRGGFSPGTADRVRTASGQRAFVKAVGAALNEHSPSIHRKEAANTAGLPPEVPSPALIGTFDDGEWVALILADIEGRAPRVPWSSAELTVVLNALLELASTPVPQSLAHLPFLEHELREAFGGWARVAGEEPEGCDPWILEHLDALETLATQGLKDLRGNSLVHGDVRADNILITDNNTAVLVDWPWACIGAGWIDALSLLINARVFDADFDVESVLYSHPVFSQVQPGSVDRVLSGLGAYFIDAARQPPPAGLPTIRAFQQQQGDAVIAWLQQRACVR